MKRNELKEGDPKEDIKWNLKNEILKSFYSVRPQEIFKLCERLYPTVDRQIGTTQAFLNNLSAHTKLMLRKGCSLRDISANINKIAMNISMNLGQTVKELMAKDLMLLVSEYLEKTNEGSSAQSNAHKGNGNGPSLQQQKQEPQSNGNQIHQTSLLRANDPKPNNSQRPASDSSQNPNHLIEENGANIPSAANLQQRQNAQKQLAQFSQSVVCISDDNPFSEEPQIDQSFVEFVPNVPSYQPFPSLQQQQVSQLKSQKTKQPNFPDIYDPIFSEQKDQPQGGKPATELEIPFPGPPLQTKTSSQCKTFILPKALKAPFSFPFQGTQSFTGKKRCLCLIDCQDILLEKQRILKEHEAEEQIQQLKNQIDRELLHCEKCDNTYHSKCMSRESPTNKNNKVRHCIFCHLKHMLPNRKVHKQIACCMLSKKKIKHEISLDLSFKDLELIRERRCYIQIRSFRLSSNNKTQNFMLFPDSCKILLNSKQIRECKPLQKLSSLKYRKDEPINVFRIESPDKRQKVSIYEKEASLASQDRIESENHLFGVYVVENLGIDQIIREYMKRPDRDIEYSKKLLLEKFEVKNGDESDIEVEDLKIPLTCSITLEKLKYPVRGIFCRHFQCFDLKSYLMILSESLHPRWLCPICKQPCYEFKMDFTLGLILSQYETDEAKEVKIKKTGEYDVLNKDGDEIQENGKLKEPEDGALQSDRQNILSKIDVFQRQFELKRKTSDVKEQYEDFSLPQKKSKPNIPQQEIIVLSD